MTDTEALRKVVKPLDLATILRHAFLSGVVAARGIPGHEEINGPELWVDYEPYEPGAYSRILAALTPSPESQAGPYAWLLNTSGHAFYERPNEHSINLYTPVYTHPPSPQPEAPAAQDQLEVMREALRQIEGHYTDTDLAAKHMAAIARAALSAAGRKEGV